MNAIGIDVALDRLLRDAAVRARFAAGGAQTLGVSAEDAVALDAIDVGELERLAARARRDVLSRRHRGTGGLLEWYPRTIAAWCAAHARGDEGADDGRDAALHELAGAFLASAAGGAWRELPAADDGVSLEEAFYRFACAAAIGDAAVRRAEFLAAIVKALALSAEPGFRLPAELRRAPRGVYAVTPGAAGAAPMLYAALAGRLVTGPLTPFLADLLSADGDAPPAIARRHRVDDDGLAASLAELERLGLK